MIDKLEKLCEVGLKISEKVNGSGLPFGFVVISNQMAWRQLRAYEYDRITYVTVQAGSPDRFVNVPGYRVFANLTLAYSENQNKYFLTHDSRPINNFLWKGEFEYNNETVVLEFEEIVETYLKNITPRKVN